MKKIIAIAFWISFALNIVDLGDRIKIWGLIKMLDTRVILEIGIITIMVISGVIYLYEKYKDFKNKLQSVLLIIDSAQYGAKGRFNDVTDILSSKIIYGRLEKFPVTNATLGPDPIYGTPKILTVRYKYCGKFHTISVPEGGTLSLPE
jgi:hypothetical protein